jgi:hypothetical protein
MRDQMLEPYLLQKMVELKSKDLLNRIESRVPFWQFQQFMHSFYVSRYGEVPLDSLNRVMQEELGVNLDSILVDWEQKTDVRFRVQDLKLERVENSWEYIVSFRVQNTGKQPGSIVGEFGRNGFPYTETILPGESKQVRWKGNANAFMLDLGLANNFPSIMNVTSQPGTAIAQTSDMTTGTWHIPASAFPVPHRWRRSAVAAVLTVLPVSGCKRWANAQNTGLDSAY